MDHNFNPPNYDNFQVYFKFLQSNPELLSPNLQNHQLPTQSSHNTMNYSENEMGENDEVVEIGSTGKQSAGRISRSKNQWVNAEDEALISAFMSHSEDARIGTSQKTRDLWVRVKALFDEARETNDLLRDRTPGMLNNRFRRIAAGVMRFVGCYEEATRNRSSGMTEEDVISNARTIHQTSFGHCKFEHCWYLLRNYRKWDDTVTRVLPDVFKTVENHRRTPTTQTDPESGGSGKRSFDKTTPSVDGENASSQRPMGIKATKKNKGKAKVIDNNAEAEKLNKTMAMFTEATKEKLNIAKLKEERKMKQMELDLKRIEVDERNMKNNLLQTLLAKPQLTSREEQLMDRLLADLGMN